MPRTSSIRYFKSRKAYYTQLRGVQHCLATGPKDEPDGPTYLAAVARFSQLMHASELDSARDEALVSVVIGRYLHSLHRQEKFRSEDFVRKMLTPAIEDFGHLKIRDLKPIHVLDWLARMQKKRPGKTREKGWNSTSCHTAFGHLNVAINWALAQKLITVNPIKGMKIESEPKVRGEAYILPVPVMDALITHASPEFALTMRVMRATGARPGEVYHAETYHYRKEIGAIVYRWNAQQGYIWKNAKKTEKDRFIFLPSDLQAEVEARIARTPTGRIFRTPKGRPWTNANVSETIRTLRKNKRVAEVLASTSTDPERVILYGFRHTYITDWLKSGRSIKIVADLCGTSVKMIERHYSHLAADLSHLRELAISFSKERIISPCDQPRS